MRLSGGLDDIFPAPPSSFFVVCALGPLRHASDELLAEIRFGGGMLSYHPCYKRWLGFLGALAMAI